ncbi:MAG: pseudouridine synthase, partial [Gemmatimonadetes bacterium]|nr:pseudouridine synthase [Gemmatimonadota bacterium]
MLTLIYQDDHYVAVDKPSGIFVHPTRLGRREPNCMSRLGRQLGRPVFTIHRLDRATSGVLLFALSSEAARKMCLLFEKRRIRKEYLAVVRGFAPETGRIDHPLRKDSNKPAADAVTDFVRMGTAELQEPVGRHDTARFSLVRA